MRSGFVFTRYCDICNSSLQMLHDAAFTAEYSFLYVAGSGVKWCKLVYRKQEIWPNQVVWLRAQQFLKPPLVTGDVV